MIQDLDKEALAREIFLCLRMEKGLVFVGPKAFHSSFDDD